MADPADKSLIQLQYNASTYDFEDHILAPQTNGTQGTDVSGAPSLIKNNFTATTNPSVTDDSASGYGIGSAWLNTSTPAEYRCIDATIGAAVWKAVGSGGGGSGTVTSVGSGTGLTGGTITSSGTLSVATNGITNSLLAQIPANRIKGNNTGSSANAIDLTTAQTTAMLDALVGDTGSGGTKGLAPAPASGDAAAGKFLKADGTWGVPAGSGTGTVTNIATTSPISGGPITTTGTISLANSGVTAASYKATNLTVDAHGLLTAASTGYGEHEYATGSGTNTITATLSPVPGSYTTGMQVWIKIANSNSGATTLNLNSLGAVAVQKNGSALTGGELVAGQIASFLYDGTQFQVTNSTVVGGVTSSFSAHKSSATQSISSTSWTTLTFDATAFNTGSYYSTATSRWTPPSGPINIVAGCEIIGLSATGDCYIGIYKNGSILQQTMKYTSEAYSYLTAFGQDVASGSDYYQIYVQLPSTGSVNNVQAYTYFSGQSFGTASVTSGTGTVTSVTFTGDGTVLSSTPSSAVTTSGTLTAELNTQTANTVLAGPTTGTASNPTFRSLVPLDIPVATSSALGAVKPDGTIITVTAGAITVPQASSSAFGVVKVDGTTITASSGVISSTGSSVLDFRNRLINGDMRIDQRNAGSSVTPSSAGAQPYILDRWKVGASQASKFTCGRNLNAVTPPTGFPYYFGISSLSAYSVAAGDAFDIEQSIEADSVSDFAFGTASAKTVALSFQVYSSLTGTFGGSLRNSAATRSYPFTYPISTANTWTRIAIIIPGDTSGTWVTSGNGIGINLCLGFGVGSTYSGTGSWASANYNSATGATSVVGTNGATFYITGVQLESGTSATTFEYRPMIGSELVLCQRYYQKHSIQLYTGGGSMTIFPVQMRASPSVSGGGTGFIAYSIAPDGLLAAQSSGSLQTMIFDAEL